MSREDALREAIQLVDDLAAELRTELDARYDGLLPQLQSRYDRDMATVAHAEASLPNLRRALNDPR